MRCLYFALLFFYSCSVWCQETVLYQNINQRAQVLQHHLNDTKDSLLLQAKGSILKVEIFNDAFEKSIVLNKSKAKIPISDLPLGRFIVEAKLPDRLIIMTIVRRQDAKAVALRPRRVNSRLDAITTNDIQPLYTAEDSANPEDSDPEVMYRDAQNTNDPKAYWVEYLISNGNSSYKTLRFANKTMADKMIAKNKLEMQSTHGKLNNLIIWEIYDTSEFLRFKRVNPDFYEIDQADFFNVKPYYSSKDYIAGI